MDNKQTGLLVNKEADFTEDDAVRIIDAINGLDPGQQVVYAIARTGWLESVPYKYGSMLLGFFHKIQNSPCSPAKHSKEIMSFKPEYEFKQRAVDNKQTGIKYYEYIVKRLK